MTRPGKFLCRRFEPLRYRAGQRMRTRVPARHREIGSPALDLAGDLSWQLRARLARPLDRRLSFSRQPQDTQRLPA